MTKLLSIPVVNKKKVHAYAERDGFYFPFTSMQSGATEIGYVYNKTKYRSYLHFVAMMGKWDPETEFLKVPVEVTDLSYGTIKGVQERMVRTWYSTVGHLKSTTPCIQNVDKRRGRTIKEVPI